MSIDATSGKTSFFKKIGNWFQKNGNTVGKAMQLGGTTAMGVGLTGMFIHEMNRPSRSIFGNVYCGCNSFGMYSSMANFDPMGMTGWMNGMLGMNGCFGNSGSMFGYGNFGCCPTMMGQNMAYQMGLQARMQDMMYPQNNYAFLNNQYQLQQNYPESNDRIDTGFDGPKKKIDHEFAELDSAQETESGKKFDTALNGLVNNNGEAIDGAEVELCTVDEANSSEQYKEAISKLAKSYIANTDKEHGNADGGITVEEYVKAETDALKDSPYHKGTKKIAAEQMFKKMDLNNDGKVDWKEYAAAIRTFDMNTKNKIDGVISSEDYTRWAGHMVEGSNTKFDSAISNNFKKLFGES